MGEEVVEGHLVIEAVKRHGVFGVALRKQGFEETHYGIHFVFQILGRGSAGIHHHGHRKGLLGLPLEDRDLLRDAVVQDLEIFLVQRAHQFAGGILDGGQYAHQAHVDADLSA